MYFIARTFLGPEGKILLSVEFCRAGYNLPPKHINHFMFKV